jgi:hypothetical protein
VLSSPSSRVQPRATAGLLIEPAPDDLLRVIVQPELRPVVPNHELLLMRVDGGKA